MKRKSLNEVSKVCAVDITSGKNTIFGSSTVLYIEIAGSPTNIPMLTAILVSRSIWKLTISLTDNLDESNSNDRVENDAVFFLISSNLLEGWNSLKWR